MNKFLSVFKDENGATAIEYGLIAALLSVAIIATLQQVSGSLVSIYEEIQTALDGATGP